MPSLTQLKYVVALDQCRHFGRAAELCNVSQPTLSAQLQKLEDELGVILFDRDKQPILPTAEGISFIDQAKVIVIECRRLEQMAKHNANEPSGEFKLGVIPTIAPYLMPILLDNFVKKYPSIEVSIEEMPTEKIIESLDRDLIDAGILATPLKLQRIAEEPLYYEPFYLFVSEKHPLASLTKISENMLNADEVWLLSDENCFRNQVIDVCTEKGKKIKLGRLELKASHLETLIEIVSNGQGYTLLPQMAADRVRKRKISGRIVEFTRPTPAREISLVHRRGPLKLNTLRALKESILSGVPKDLARERSRAMHIVGIN